MMPGPRRTPASRPANVDGLAVQRLDLTPASRERRHRAAVAFEVHDHAVDAERREHGAEIVTPRRRTGIDVELAAVHARGRRAEGRTTLDAGALLEAELEEHRLRDAEVRRVAEERQRVVEAVVEDAGVVQDVALVRADHVEWVRPRTRGIGE